MSSKYWDDFERRIDETVKAYACGSFFLPPIRRVAIFITDACNFKCAYCNHVQSPHTMSRVTFRGLFYMYGRDTIYHITGGEPSVVPWLYQEIIDKSMDGYKIHLNTNCFKAPPAAYVQRLKVSLDHYDASIWNRMVGRNAFDTVCRHIYKSSKQTCTSITYTLSKLNYKDCVEFALWAQDKFPKLYAIFFSVYKGIHPAYAWDDETVEDFWINYRPDLLEYLNGESKRLLLETMDEKRRLMQGVRFEDNSGGKICHLALSERVVGPDGNISRCSHLYRDGIHLNTPVKHAKCMYGCNQRLVQFNQEVERRLHEKDI